LKKLFIILLILITTNLYSDNISFETFTLTFHLSENSVSNGHEYPRRLDDRGWIIFMPGLELGYEYSVKNNFIGIKGYKLMIGSYSDSRAQQSGYLQIGPRWIINITNKIDINLGIGPLLFFRDSWKKFKNYNGNAFLKEKYGYEYIIFVYGDIDIRYKVNNDFMIVWGVIPVIPYSIANTIGFSYNW